MTDVDLYQGWNPQAQRRALDALQAARNDTWRPFYCPKAGCDGKPHDDWKWNHARQDQHPPTDDDWLTWLLMSGRGAGKTRTGSEYTHRMSEVTGRIAIVAATGPDARDIMIEGESGLMSIARPGFKPHYEPSKRRLTWPNGCIGAVFSGEEPDRIRGPEHGYAWIDEPAHFPLIQDVWDNLMFGLRIGRRPRVVCTTTPKPRPWLKALMKESDTRIARASTYANLDNLAPVFAKRVIARYEGTRLGRQELHGEILEDIEGALWNWEMIEPFRLTLAPALGRVLVGVDPAGTANKRSDETGIIVAATDADYERGYVLADRSGKMSPLAWARTVDAACDEFSADAIVVETNYGGDMVAQNLRSAGITRRIIEVNSRRGKALRAEPIVGLYELQVIHHVGMFMDLEEQMCSWQPYEDRDSPDRVDALVHVMTALFGKRTVATVASPTALKPRTGTDQARARRHLGIPHR